VHDPVADPDHARREYGLDLYPKDALRNLDALVLAVPHQVFLDDMTSYWSFVRQEGYIVDVKSVLKPDSIPQNLRYWSL
jgi:UDP-N-acetyl-D-galactosamine dehydrogenase